MSNTVKIKNRKKKSEVKVNYKLWAIVFGVFVAVIVGLSVWASFHWGVGFGTIGSDPMTSEEAILQMELLEHNFFVYKDGESGGVNVVYKRADGSYGLLETEE